MDLKVLFCLFSTISIFIAFITFSRPKHKNLPPGPQAWPLIGNLPLLRTDTLHITLADLARTHGPIMTLWLGAQPTVVASTPESALEILKTHDRVCSGRHARMSLRLKRYIEYSLAWSDRTEHWNRLRKLARTEIFSAKMLQAQRPVREEKVGEMMDYLRTKEGQAVTISKFVFGTSLNILGNAVFSKNVFVYGDDDEEGGKEGIQTLIREMLRIGGAPNLAEFYPILEGLDLQGLKRKCAYVFNKIAKLWEGIVEERKLKRHEEAEDILDVILADGFSDAQIDILFLEIFAPGSESISATIEWVMAELIKNPKEMAKVQKELDEVAGASTVKESHLPQLPYLHACIKEAMRMHPVGPLLIPRRAVESCEVMGYTIPKDCQIMVNVYAIGRSPESWNDPNTFCPERFMESDVDYYGGHYKFIPFGSGMRICIGMPLATRTIPLIVGSLLHTYDWSLPNRKRSEELEMNEKWSLSMAIDPSLCVVPNVRP